MSDSKGFTLIELVITMGLLSFVALAVATLSADTMKILKGAQHGMDYAELITSIQTTTDEAKSCTPTLVGQPYMVPGTQAVEYTTPSGAKFKAGVIYSGWKFNRVELVHRTSPGVNVHLADFVLSLEKVGKSYGPQTKEFSHLMRIETDASMTIVACRSAPDLLKRACESQNKTWDPVAEKCL